MQSIASHVMLGLNLCNVHLLILFSLKYQHLVSVPSKYTDARTSLGVQWLRLRVPTAGSWV